MTCTSNTAEPVVRIGMIRATDKVSFRGSEPCALCDGEGKVRTKLAPGQCYEALALESVPAEIEYFVRLAIAEDEITAANLAAKEAQKGWPTTYRQEGLVVDLGASTVDNREY